jgi:hypothetical protein
LDLQRIDLQPQGQCVRVLLGGVLGRARADDATPGILGGRAAFAERGRMARGIAAAIGRYDD